MTVSAALSINVIGAGIGGLSAALALLRNGHHVRVFERTRELLEVGAGLTLTPNATRVLRYLGLGDALARIASVPHRGAVLHWQTGAELVENTRAEQLERRYGAPYCQVHRADLQQLLIQAITGIDPDCLRLDARCIAAEADAQGAAAVFADGSRARADVLIGADGLRSIVREQMFAPDEPRFTGQVAWRGLLPTAGLDPASFEPPSAMSIGPGRIFTRYLLRSGSLVNFVAIVRDSRWTIESWSARGDLAELLAHYAGWSRQVRALIAATPAELLYKWALFDRPPLECVADGRCALLGDAAHPMLPFLGQGAAMAIEDACVLARAFTACADPVEALERYQAARLERTTRVAAASRSAGERFQQAPADDYSSASHVSAISLDLPAYDATMVPV